MEQQEFNFREQVKTKVNELKGNWISLANDLYSIFKDKLFIDYGYETFAHYCQGELNILPSIAKKMVTNMFFLENNRPELASDKAKEHYKLPELDAVNVLKSAHKGINKKIGLDHYEKLEKAVIDDNEPVKKVRTMLKDFKEEFENKDPSEIIIEKRKKELNGFLKVLDRIGSFIKEPTIEETKKIEETKGIVINQLNKLMEV